MDFFLIVVIVALVAIFVGFFCFYIGLEGYKDCLATFGVVSLVAGLIMLFTGILGAAITTSHKGVAANKKATATCAPYAMTKLNSNNDGYFIFTCAGGEKANQVQQVKR